MSDELRVTFCAFTDASQEGHSEEELTTHFDALRPALMTSKPLQGSVVISDGSREARITDELWAVVAGLCFRTIEDLLNNRVHVYSCFETNLCVVLIPIGDTVVHLVGDDIPSFDVHKGSLLKRLFECGQRYVALLEKLRDDPDQTVREIAHQVPAPP